MKVGDKVKVVARETYHNFEIGDIVTLKRLETYSGHLFVDSRGLENWMSDIEYEPISDTPEVGTLAAHNVTNGDVVEYVPDGEHYTVREGKRLQSRCDDLIEYSRFWDHADNFRIVSRASDARSPVELAVDLGDAIKQVVAESQSGPVQLRKVIVPGVYGPLTISKASEGLDITMYVHSDDRHGMIAARGHMTALIDAMSDEQ